MDELTQIQPIAVVRPHFNIAQKPIVDSSEMPASNEQPSIIGRLNQIEETKQIHMVPNILGTPELEPLKPTVDESDPALLQPFAESKSEPQPFVMNQFVPCVTNSMPLMPWIYPSIPNVSGLIFGQIPQMIVSQPYIFAAPIFQPVVFGMMPPNVYITPYPVLPAIEEPPLFVEQMTPQPQPEDTPRTCAQRSELNSDIAAALTAYIARLTNSSELSLKFRFPRA